MDPIPQLPPVPATEVLAPVCAGFPSPADDYEERPVDLRRMLAPGGREHVHRAEGPGTGTLAYILDQTARPVEGDLVLAAADGRIALARAVRHGRGLRLREGGRDLPALDARALGVATWRLRGFRNARLGESGLDGFGPGGPSTFLFRVSGHSMRDAGIGDRDLLVVDRAEPPRHGDVVVAVSNGARSVKRLLVEGGRAVLAFENAEAFPDPMPHHPETTVFGVVAWCLHRLRP